MLAHLVKLCECLVRGSTGFSDNALRVAPRLDVGLLQPHLKLGLHESSLLCVLFRLTQLDSRLVSVLLKQHTRLLKLLNRRFKAGALGADAVLRVLDYILAKAEAA